MPVYMHKTKFCVVAVLLIGLLDGRTYNYIMTSTLICNTIITETLIYILEKIFLVPDISIKNITDIHLKLFLLLNICT
jgi:hypothetical protein